MEDIERDLEFEDIPGLVKKNYGINFDNVGALQTILGESYIEECKGLVSKAELLKALCGLYVGCDLNESLNCDSIRNIGCYLVLTDTIQYLRSQINKDSTLNKSAEYNKSVSCKQLREDIALFLKCVQAIYFLDSDAYTSMDISKDNLMNVLESIIKYVSSGDIEIRYNTPNVLEGLLLYERAYVFVCFSEEAKVHFEELSGNTLRVYRGKQGTSVPLVEVVIAFINNISLIDSKILTNIYNYCNRNCDKLYEYVALNLKSRDIQFVYPCECGEVYISYEFMYKHKLFEEVISSQLYLLNVDKTVSYDKWCILPSNIRRNKDNTEDPVRIAFFEDYLGVSSSVIDFVVSYEFYPKTVESIFKLKTAIKDCMTKDRFRIVRENTGYFPYVLLGYYECTELFELGLVGSLETMQRVPCNIFNIELNNTQKNMIYLLATILGGDIEFVEMMYRKCNFNSVQTFDYIKSDVNNVEYFSFIRDLLIHDNINTCNNIINATESLNLNVHETFEHLGGLIQGNIDNANILYGMEKLRARQGHGFAAERANHFIDKVTLKKVELLGDDNAKNGADRCVNGLTLQSKYCATPSRCVSACFKNNSYRYYNADGSPMIIEVPKGMGVEAVKFLERRIEKGEVPGVSDIKQAKDLIKEGNITYTQAKHLAKAGNIDSLIFDASNGMVIATKSLGISATIAFATALWNGEDVDIALKNAIFTGIKIGGVTFVTSVISSQLTKAGLNSLLVGTTDSIVKMIGPKASATLVNSLRTGTDLYGACAMTSASKVLRGNLITGAVSVLVLSTDDIFDAFEGRISQGQLIKNVTNTTCSVVGGTGGAMCGTSLGASIGTAICPGAGTIVGGAIGGILGSLAGGSVSNAVATTITDVLIEDDAIYLLEIIQNEFKEVVVDYMLTKNEADTLAKKLGETITPNKLKDMFASSNKYNYANRIIVQCCEDICSHRETIAIPDDSSIMNNMKVILEDMCIC